MQEHRLIFGERHWHHIKTKDWPFTNLPRSRQGGFQKGRNGKSSDGYMAVQPSSPAT
jgi:hypothetical protein